MRLRERHTFGERAKTLSTDEVKRKLFLIYEGRNTERIYFEQIEQRRGKRMIDPLIELVPVFRSFSEEGWSNPKIIVDQVLLHLHEMESGEITCRSLLDWFMDYFYEMGVLITSKAEARSIYAELKYICTDRKSCWNNDPGDADVNNGVIGAAERMRECYIKIDAVIHLRYSVSDPRGVHRSAGFLLFRSFRLENRPQNRPQAALYKKQAALDRIPKTFYCIIAGNMTYFPSKMRF